jgi:hypothetical protein
MQELICAAMRRVRPDIVCERAAGPEQALRGAVELAGGGPVLFLYEKLAAAREAVAAIGAVPWPESSLPEQALPGAALPRAALPGEPVR